MPVQTEKKKLTIVIPCYNEEDNVVPLAEAIFKVTDEKCPNYLTELLFIDNYSTDKTREELRTLAKGNKRIKCIFNARNFGHIRSPYYGLTQADGDLVMLMCADFQDPPELIPEFVKKWEEGYRVIVGQKKKSLTNPLVNFVRNVYYHIIHRISAVEQVEYFTGFGLYDKGFIRVLASLGDPYPYLRGIVAELGYRMATIDYTQPKRKAGKTHNNFATLYDMAMNGLTSYSTFFVRSASFVGVFFGFGGFTGGIVYLVFLILALVQKTPTPNILYPILAVSFFLAGIILFFIGMVGEYVLQINKRVLNRPYVVEEERINFEE